MKEFFDYIKRPYFLLKAEKINVKEFFNLLLLSFFISLILGIIIIVVSKLIHEKLDIHKFFSFRFKLYLIFIGPVFEEIYFRLLLRVNKRNLGIFSVTNFFVVVFFIFHKHYLTAEILASVNILILLLIRFFTLAIVKNFLVNNFNYYFYFSAVLFGILHIFNFDINIQVILLAFILTSKQITGGIFLGYIRLKYGLRYSILFHSLVNLLVVIL